MKDNLVKLFEKVQKIPYKVCKYDKDEINENLKEGDCRHKSQLLQKLLEREGFEVRETRISFYWDDLPLPKELLSLLKSGTLFYHRSLRVKIDGKWLNVDCTWNPELKSKDFPVTENWDGKSDTKQVTEGKIKIFDKDKFDKSLTEKINREEALEFADALNKWLNG